MAVKADWAALPSPALRCLAGQLCAADRARAALACRSWAASFADAWDGLSAIAPRRLLPTLFPKRRLRLASLPELRDAVAPLLARLRPAALRSLDLSAPAHRTRHRLLPLPAPGLDAFFGQHVALFARLTTLGLGDCLLGHLEIAVLARNLPSVEVVKVSVSLYNPCDSPLAEKDVILLSERRALLRPFRLSERQVLGLGLLELFLLQSLSAFPRLCRVVLLPRLGAKAGPSRTSALRFASPSIQSPLSTAA